MNPNAWKYTAICLASFPQEEHYPDGSVEILHDSPMNQDAVGEVVDERSAGHLNLTLLEEELYVQIAVEFETFFTKPLKTMYSI